MAAQQKRILVTIVLSQFLCTTPWFVGNAVLSEISAELSLPASAIGNITSSVQLGFIIGTLLYALFAIADRFKPSTVFLISAIAVAMMNALIIFADDFAIILLLRFLTGFFLAGVYPVGMKIATDHYDKGLGTALGFLVGALVLGTSFPHLLKGLSFKLSWKLVLGSVSILSVAGGLLMYLLVPNGLYRMQAKKINMNYALQVFKPKVFRSAAFGYFGHMWELYTFWAFLPLIIITYFKKTDNDVHPSLLAFSVIAIGCIACIVSGFISRKIGVKRTAFIALACSGLCCLLSPLSFELPLVPFLLYLFFWGWMVIADSPMFSTLIAQNAVMEQKGTALTIVTSIGFAITIVSIELLNRLKDVLPYNWLYALLAIGPLLGLVAIKRNSLY